MSHQQGNNDARRSSGIVTLWTEVHRVYGPPASWTTSPCHGLIENEIQGGKEKSGERIHVTREEFGDGAEG